MYIGTLAPRSNKASWVQTFEILDDDTDEDIDLSGASIVLELVNPLTDSSALTASTDNGKITITDTGVFTLNFTATDMRTLDPITYQVGCTLTINGETLQYIIGTVPVLNGIVT